MPRGQKKLTDEEIFDTAPPSAEVESLPKRIQALKRGESYALARRLDVGVTLDEVTEARKSMHDTARAAMGRVSRSTGFQFDGEQCDCRTTQGFKPALFYLITRTK